MMSGLLDELLNKDTENPDPEKEQKEGKIIWIRLS